MVIVSYAHRYVFIKTRKTGGTAVQVALEPMAGDDAIVGGLDRKRLELDVGAGYRARGQEAMTSPDTGHMTAMQVIEWIGRDRWEDFYRFSIERNPWDKAISYYYFVRATKPDLAPFPQWVKGIAHDQLSNFHMYAVNGGVGVSRILRYESLAEEFADLCNHLGLPDLQLPVARAHLRPVATHDWRRMYDDAAAGHIAEVCAAEIELLGYSFDDAVPLKRPSQGPGERSDALEPPDPDEASLLALEASAAFEWGPSDDAVSPGARLMRRGFIGECEAAQSWIFDHVPTAGGEEFGQLAHRRLLPHDHLKVRWPSSWQGVLVGRLRRAALVHGHGARYAETLAPDREWKLAMCVRDPLESVMSIYQQARRTAIPIHPVETFETWFEAQLATGHDLNRQVLWLGGARASSAARFGAENPLGLTVDELADRAFERLDRCERIGRPATVDRLFEQLTRSAELPVRAEDAHPHEDASAVPSPQLLDELPDQLLERLRAATVHDQELYERATKHPGWVT